jgi:hypothetical protein
MASKREDIKTNKLSIYLIKEEYSDVGLILKNADVLESQSIPGLGILAGEVQFNRLARVDQPCFMNMKTAARTKYAALTFGPAVATTHGVSSQFENEK